jgi:hypothetical protein
VRPNLDSLAHHPVATSVVAVAASVVATVVAAMAEVMAAWVVVAAAVAASSTSLTLVLPVPQFTYSVRPCGTDKTFSSLST